jgi:CelD/BcsL family acetyltransferase involved in cellulose biosynthesis
MTATDWLERATPLMLDRAAAAIAGARRAGRPGHSEPADRSPAASFAAEWRSFAELESIAAEWRALAARALEPNVFYEPSFALAAAPLFGRDAGAVLIWSAAKPRQLLGLFPARVEKRRYGVKLPVLAGWTHAYGPLGTPLVDRDAAEAVVAAWLGYIAGDSELPGLLLLPLVPQDGGFAATLKSALQRAQMPVAAFGCHRRALLAPHDDRTHYAEHALGARKIKELRRVMRRLSETGAVLLTTTSEAAAIAAALEDFLELEAGGWKGKAGTAAACDDNVSGFVTAALGGLAAEGKAAIKRLLVDGRPIAAAITLRSGDGAWFWKTAYDESFARYSPGVVLATALTEDLAEDGSIAQTDSCAIADHPMINQIWRERLALCDILIGVRSRAPFSRARQLEALRRNAIAAAKRLRSLVRG